MITSVKDIKKNLYRVLDLSPEAKHNDILHAYNRIKTAYGKDALASYSLIDENCSREILEEIEFAYAILGNARKRREYDLSMGYANRSDFSDEKELCPQPLPRLQNSNSSPEDKPAPVTIAPLHQKPVQNMEFEERLKNCSSLSGEFLRALRIYRGFSEEQLAQVCQLNPHHIFTIEEEDPKHLAHPTYLRGHLLLICRYLEIDNAQPLVKDFISRLQKEKKLPSTAFAV